MAGFFTLVLLIPSKIIILRCSNMWEIKYNENISHEIGGWRNLKLKKSWEVLDKEPNLLIKVNIVRSPY